MSNVAVVFPGQGSQRLGMGLDFAEKYRESRQVFERAAQALPFDVVAPILEDETRLNLTEFTQPCILAAEIAMLDALKAHFGFDPDYFGGHSLGEYTALVAAGAMPLETALQLVHLRGQLMQKAVPAGAGSMAALIWDRLPGADVRRLVEGENVDVANDNSPSQVVLSGDKGALERVIVALKPYVDQGMRVVTLTVSAPFHSRHMAVVEPEFRGALELVKRDLDAAKAARVTSNYSGGFHTGSADDLIDRLTRQIGGTVRWRDNMAALASVSEKIVEVGPNRPLRGFFSAIGVSISAVTDVRSAGKLAQEVA